MAMDIKCLTPVFTPLLGDVPCAGLGGGVRDPLRRHHDQPVLLTHLVPLGPMNLNYRLVGEKRIHNLLLGLPAPAVEVEDEGPGAAARGVGGGKV